MKYRTTQKAVRNGYYKTVCIGYCGAQYLLMYQNPTAYTCGGCGWNADIYDFDNVAIVTGYRPFGNVKVDYDMLEAYENKAREITSNHSIDYDEKKRLVNELLKDFIKTACNVKVVNV